MGRNSPNGRLGISAAARPFAGEPRLGYLAERRAEDSIRQVPVRALALLEGIRHRCRRRSDGPPDQRHAVYARLERGAAIGIRTGRNLPLEGRPQHAGPARGAVRLSRNSRIRPAGAWHGNARTCALHGPERDSGCQRYRASVFTAKRRGYGAELLLGQLSPRKCARSTSSQWHAKHDARTRDTSRLSDDALYEGNNWDDVKPHLWNFFRSVKTRKPAVEDAVFGNHAGYRLPHGERVVFQKKAGLLDAASHTIKS